MTLIEIIAGIVFPSMIALTVTVFFVIELWTSYHLNKPVKKKGRKPKSPTDYPYLPLTMETEHFGWSYELGRNGGFSYHIWSVDQNHKILVVRFKAKSRTKAIETCRELEKRRKKND